MEKNILIGIDIGGTTVKNAILTREGAILKKWEIPTDLKDNGANIPHDIWHSIQENLKELNIDKKQCLGVGTGAPGFIEPETGTIAVGVNISWNEFPLKDILEELSGLPVFIDNDANVAALGENWKGAGHQVNNMLAVTLGTGVGGGIIANGQLISGANGTASEIGHITVEKDGALCNCGRRGCLETVASATGMVRLAEELIADGKSTALKQRKQANGNITTKDIFELAKEGDQELRQLIEHVTDVLGSALASIAIVTNPSKIVIGGGVSKAGNQLLEPLKKAFSKYVLPRTEEACEFEIAALSNDAGVYGAAYLVLQNQE